MCLVTTKFEHPSPKCPISIKFPFQSDLELQNLIAFCKSKGLPLLFCICTERLLIGLQDTCSQHNVWKFFQTYKSLAKKRSQIIALLLITDRRSLTGFSGTRNDVILWNWLRGLWVFCKDKVRNHKTISVRAVSLARETLSSLSSSLSDWLS